jgi:HSP20 family protein
MSKEENMWSRWFNQGNGWPFNQRWVAEDVEDAFVEMENFMNRRFKELSKKAPKSLVRERSLPEGEKMKEWGPFVYGYTMTIGSDGKPRIREFGNLKLRTRFRRPELDITEEREPLTDVLNTNGEIKVIIELPGVVKEDIKLTGTEKTLTVSVDTENRKYFKKLDLPVEVNHETAIPKYRHGVLEVTIKKNGKETKTEELEIQ